MIITRRKSDLIVVFERLKGWRWKKHQHGSVDAKRRVRRNGEHCESK